MKVTLQWGQVHLQGNLDLQLLLQVMHRYLEISGVKGGPIVCQQGSQLQCYQPSSANRLLVQVNLFKLSLF